MLQKLHQSLNRHNLDIFSFKIMKEKKWCATSVCFVLVDSEEFHCIVPCKFPYSEACVMCPLVRE